VEGGGVRSGPGEARTILLFHIISARPSKQPLMQACYPSRISDGPETQFQLSRPGSHPARVVTVYVFVKKIVKGDVIAALMTAQRA
jgi:hypothetical protein